MLEARGLVVRYRDGADAVVRGVDLDVARGESVAIMGRSGSGKSTLLFAMAGVLPLSEGEVTINGVVLTSLSPRAQSAFRLQHVGFVFQRGDLVPELTLCENVALPLRMTGMRRRDSRSRALEALDRLGVDAATAGREPSAVSGGQLQRAAIARALVHGPALVLADEPTGALDSANSSQAIALLVEAAKDRGSAVVVVTHDGSVADHCQRQLTMVDGRLT